MVDADNMGHVALGFLFGQPGSRVAYLSDTNGIPARTMELLKAEPIDVLVLDALFLQVGLVAWFGWDMKVSISCRVLSHQALSMLITFRTLSASTRRTSACPTPWMLSASFAPNGPISPA